MATLLEAYLGKIKQIRSLGAATEELTYYEALQETLNTLGSKCKPKVFCIGQLKDMGAGHPDFGLYTANQLRKATLRDPVPDQLPERGVIEVKGVNESVGLVGETAQIGKYWERYGLVLITNYRSFRLIGRDARGQRVELEYFRLAESPDAFWEMVATPRKTAASVALQFEEFLKRILLHNARLSQPRDVAWFLASYARDALARLDDAGDMEALDLLRSSLEEALGMTFEADKGRHFFLSTLVQTLFYGLFSAWVLWCKQHAGDPEKRKGFDYRSAHWHMRLPVLRALFEQVNSPAKLGPLKLDQIMEWAVITLHRVDEAAFFSHFREEEAVLYFYEPFLEAFDPTLRKQLGVWYTPPEVVEYMVERVDTVLRTELDIADGLADPSVYVLDPCCGTGSYLVAVLKRIERTLRAKGEDALIGADIKAAALDRVFGFELLPAPLVVAHLQLNLLLEGLGVELGKRFARGTEEVERAAVYLTNALTGWQSPEERDHHLPLPELENEMDRAGEVKEQKPVPVVLGNPPYYGYAGMAVAEERDLSTAYRTVKRVRPSEGQGLNDLYVRFFRMAERRIVERTGRGVVCFISNYSWLDGLSFTGMRERYLEAFDRIWIDCLNGDKYKTGKLTPDGASDPSIFSTERNPAGIQVGTAIALMVRKEDHAPSDSVHFRHLWGKEKRAELRATAEQKDHTLYETVTPPIELGLPVMPTRVAPDYLDWPLLPQLFPVSFPGVKTSRDQALVDIDRARLEQRMSLYFDPNMTDEQVAKFDPALMTNTARFDAKKTREFLIRRGFRPDGIVRYCYRPFDQRWLYWEPETRLLDRNRANYIPHVDQKHPWIEARGRQIKGNFDRGYLVRVLADNFGNGLSSYFPLYLKRNAGSGLLLQSDELEPNLSPNATDYLETADANEQDLFYHALATLNTPAYRTDNAGALRQDWPRVTLPASTDALLQSAELGRELADLLDPGAAADGVSSGAIRAEIKAIGAAARVGGGQLSEKDLKLAARWGYAGQNDVTMPGPGDARERDYDDEERKAIARGATALGMAPDEALALLGETTYDVHLNDTAYWGNVPARVWRYTLGGYQVIKKWLSYREFDLLGRPLRTEEVREVTGIARRIAAILLMAPALDASYRAVCQDTYAWPRDN